MCCGPLRQRRFERILYRFSAGPRLVLRRAYFRRVDDRALYRHADANAASVLGDGHGVYRIQPVCRPYQFQSPSLVRLLDRLCGDGYVCRTEDIHDRRAKALSLTERGRELVQAVEAQLVRLRKDVLADIAPDDLQAALRVLRAFEAAEAVSS